MEHHFTNILYGYQNILEKGMGPIKETMKQLKWVILAGVIVAILIGLITANFHVLQFMKYKMNNDTVGIVKTLESSVTEKSQNEWYFKQGIAYLLEQPVYTDEIKAFFEGHFGAFNEETQKEIIKGYNKQKMTLPMSAELMNFLLTASDKETVKVYMQNMKPEELEEGLILVYGTKPEVNKEFVIALNELLANYPEKLPFNKFKFSLYNVLTLGNGELQQDVKKIFNKIDPVQANSYLFGELKNKEILEKDLVSLVKLLKDAGIISLSDSNEYDSLYSELCMARSQYQGMDEEVIGLQNKKDSIEAQIQETIDKLKTKNNEIASMQTQVNEIEGQLESLTNYSFMPLYIESAAGTGSNEYIASIPRGGLFGILKPSDQKFIVKLVGTSFSKDGVYNLNVYLKGSKQADNGAQYAYYVEVSSADISKMESIAADRDTKVNALNGLKEEAAKMQASIDTVKKENNYDEVIEALNSVDSRREEYVNKVNEKIAAIKELFGFRKLTISIDDE